MGIDAIIVDDPRGKGPSMHDKTGKWGRLVIQDVADETHQHKNPPQ